MEIGCSSTGGSMNDEVSVDVDALALSLREEFKQLHPVSKERCIYRVAKGLRVLNEKAYTPQCVSIGPYHHGKEELKAMEEHKTLYLQHFLRYSEVSLEKFVLCVRDNETMLRNCYQERINLSSERFVRLVLVDAAFVIMVMSRGFSSEFDEDELVYDKPWMKRDIKKDMILLENQLPFFILDELLHLSNLKVGRFSLLQISSNFLNFVFTSWEVNTLEMSQLSECRHLVDFLRVVQQPLEQNNKHHREIGVVNLPSALELHQSGVKFKRGSSLRLADINFNLRDGVLEIPQLRITDSSETLFRNLLAFEQIHLPFGKKYLNDYITVISFFVTNGNDVEILTKEGIIQNWLHSDKQVVLLLNNLNKGNLLNTNLFYFTDVVNDLNEYCSKRRNRWRAGLIQNYFYSPWSIVSVSAAAFVILLSIIQTIFSILQFVKQ